MQDMFHYKLFSDNYQKTNMDFYLTNLAYRNSLLLWITGLNPVLNSGYPVDIIYFDFNKAFDSVPLHRLLTKLRSYGICSNLLSWLRGFLIGRKQQVTFNNVQLITVDWFCQWSPPRLSFGSCSVFTVCKWHSLNGKQQSSTFRRWYKTVS